MLDMNFVQSDRHPIQVLYHNALNASNECNEMDEREQLSILIKENTMKQMIMNKTYL